jgi:hypothetical protein
VVVALLAVQGGADRGYVLKGVEEVLLLLEDMGLNLQSMMASPYVRPFSDDVRTWEQRLSLIGESIEVRWEGQLRQLARSTDSLVCDNMALPCGATVQPAMGRGWLLPAYLSGAG